MTEVEPHYCYFCNKDIDKHGMRGIQTHPFIGNISFSKYNIRVLLCERCFGRYVMWVSGKYVKEVEE